MRLASSLSHVDGSGVKGLKLGGTGSSTISDALSVGAFSFPASPASIGLDGRPPVRLHGSALEALLHSIHFHVDVSALTALALLPLALLSASAFPMGQRGIEGSGAVRRPYNDGISDVRKTCYLIYALPKFHQFMKFF